MFYLLDAQLYKLDTWGVTQFNQDYDFYTLAATSSPQKIQNYLKSPITNCR